MTASTPEAMNSNSDFLPGEFSILATLPEFETYKSQRSPKQCSYNRSRVAQMLVFQTLLPMPRYLALQVTASKASPDAGSCQSS